MNALDFGDPTVALLVLLVCGHLVGDFALQTRRMAEGKHRGSVLFRHILVLALAHLVALAPLLSLPLAALVGAIALAHGMIDFAKARAGRRGRGMRGVRAEGGGHGARGGSGTSPSLAIFVLDQVAHIAVLVAGWALFIRWMGPPDANLAAPAAATFVTAAVLAAAFAFNATGGGAVVSGVLAAHDPTLEEEAGRRDEAPSEVPASAGSGRMIGILERTLVLILLLVGQWAALGILIAAKSIARFDELKERRFSEYYLIGTLTSLLVAVVVGLVVRGVLVG